MHDELRSQLPMSFGEKGSRHTGRGSSSILSCRPARDLDSYMLHILYDGLRRALYRPLSTGLQEVKGVRPDQLHDKFKRDGAPAAPSVGPPRPPGFGPPRPPAAAAGGAKAAATGEEAEVGPPRPPADDDGEEDEEDAGGYPGEAGCWVSGLGLHPLWSLQNGLHPPHDPHTTLCISLLYA